MIDTYSKIKWWDLMHSLSGFADEIMYHHRNLTDNEIDFIANYINARTHYDRLPNGTWIYLGMILNRDSVSLKVTVHRAKKRNSKRFKEINYGNKNK